MNRKFIYIGCTVFAMSLLSMTGVQAQEESKDSLVNVAFGKVAQEDLTHAISTVNTSELTKKTANNNSLVGLESFVGGLQWIHPLGTRTVGTGRRCAS